MQVITGRAVAPTAVNACHCSKKTSVGAIVPTQRLRLSQAPVKEILCGNVATAAVRRIRNVMQAAAQAEAPASSADSSEQGWYGLVANAEFMLYDVQNESFAEQLREKTRLYKEQGKDVDFFLVSEPAWLDSKFPAESKRVRRPCVALVCKNKNWATFMKLRLDRVLMLDLSDLPEGELFKSSGPVPEFPAREGWTAPYTPYSKGWWEPFMRSQ